jgi:hypothetical protein
VDEIEFLTSWDEGDGSNDYTSDGAISNESGGEVEVEVSGWRDRSDAGLSCLPLCCFIALINQRDLAAISPTAPVCLWKLLLGTSLDCHAV